MNSVLWVWTVTENLCFYYFQQNKWYPNAHVIESWNLIKIREPNNSEKKKKKKKGVPNRDVQPSLM